MQQLRKDSIPEVVSVVVRMDANPRHLMHFDAAAQIFLPVRELGIDGTERDEYARPVPTAVIRQPLIGARYILMQDSVESAGPCLSNVAFVKPRDHAIRFISSQTAERPAGQIHIHVDHSTNSSIPDSRSNSALNSHPKIAM